MSLDNAILGFLSFKPMSGYDLKKTFDRSVQHFWPANQSQIYRTLYRLEKGGMVEHEIIKREGPLDIKQYRITAVGKEALHKWLSTPLPDHDFREPFLIQIYFGGKLSDEELLAIIENQEQRLKEQQAVFRLMLQEYIQRLADEEIPRPLFISVTTLEFGILTNETALTWLESLRRRIQDKDYLVFQF